ncbi:glucose dehydrogenase [FAD, quinone]-like [Coccinella septempunctata]|uniref:glucose dehydrogenase [FAD, quinone]-like n=1 Tax=Coccinella septempunctata TaxID=41139 RepID=UPI001D0732DC|nr:glucose dehydrogenase [FAD, quinone]-like [Coccinella septempunctata]
MLTLLFFITTLCYVECLDQSSFELQVRYLEDIVKREVERAETYKKRDNNRDLIGTAGNAKPIEFGTFDFIVIGGGTSGSVVANRLTENPKWKVLLLEAGDINDDYTDIPFVFDASAASDRNWGYTTENQRNGCFGRDRRRCPYPRGKILGGSGTINGLFYSRGIKADYDKWADAGNPGWSWDDVLPYFKKLENYEAANRDPNFRGTGGPVNVGYIRPETEPIKAFLQATKEIGIRYVQDYNAANINGASWLQHTIHKGKRVSGANNYVRPALNRTNFNLTLKAFATKIVIDPKTKGATGVEFVKNNVKYVATATKEVILSAGSINSPQLLMLSGIGPKGDLGRFGVPLIHDLPVGQFMKDHIWFTGLHLSSNYVEPTLSTNQLIRRYLEGTAPLHQRSVAYFNSRNWGSPLPNIELAFAPPFPTELKFPTFDTANAEVRKFESKIDKASDWQLQLSLLHPKSSGVLKLRSKDPVEFPAIDSGIFDDKEDLEDLYRAIELALSLANTSVGRSFNLTLNLNLPSCPNTRLKTDPREHWYCVLRQLALPAYHLSSTVKMGPGSDPQSCVDHELKIHGVNSLRVVDVSIVPSTVTGHINAQAFLIGEKGADLIKKDHM